MSGGKSIIQGIQETGVVAIFRKLPPAVILPLAEALVRAGITAVELTVESEGAFEAIAQLRERYGSELLIGAGTLMTVEELQQAVSAGANFLLSPHLDTRLVTAGKELGVPMIPGVLTPTEVVQATSAGAEVLKLFPAAPLGPAYLKDLLGPFKGRAFIPTGGITVNNLGDFIKAGALAVGMGSSLATASEIANKDWGRVQERVRLALETVKLARSAQ